MELLSLRLLHTLDTGRKAQNRQTKNNVVQDSRGGDATVSSIAVCWSTIEKGAKDQLEWKSLVAAFCILRVSEDP